MVIVGGEGSPPSAVGTEGRRRDPLTRLRSRRAFEARLEALLGDTEGSPRHHALLYIHIEGLRPVVSVFGSEAGDALLRRIGKRLQGRLRAPDFAARLEEDVYGVLLHRRGRQDALRVAEQIYDALSTLRFCWEGRPCLVRVAMGVAAVRPGSDTLPEVLRAADRACREAAGSGAGFLGGGDASEPAGERLRRGAAWGSRVAGAMEEGRLVLYFQRMQPLRAGEGIEGRGEILLRMVDPGGGLVAPAQFMAAAERYHLAPVLDRWVVRNTLAGLARRRREQPGGPAQRVFVNLSGGTLQDEHFPEFLERQFAAHGVPPAWMGFEIREAEALARLRGVPRVMAALREMGCGVAIDDFGGGVSPAAVFRRMPVDLVKIHGPFVRGMAYDESCLGLVAGVHRRALALGAETVGGFVENREVLPRLTAVGVHYAQGYAVDTPKAWCWGGAGLPPPSPPGDPRC